MNKIRKFGAWLWLNKERMILGVLVILLCYRVYAILMGEVDLGDDNVITPTASGPVGSPLIPPSTPRVPPGGAVVSLVNKNPLSYVAGLETDADGEIRTYLTLVSITSVDDEPRARIRPRGGRPRSRKVGDQVDNWIISRIREDSVEVRHALTGQLATLTVAKPGGRRR